MELKDLGVSPQPRKFFEKNLVKLLIKCNFIAFFGKSHLPFFLPSLKGKVSGVSLTEGFKSKINLYLS